MQVADTAGIGPTDTRPVQGHTDGQRKRCCGRNDRNYDKMNRPEKIDRNDRRPGNTRDRGFGFHEIRSQRPLQEKSNRENESRQNGRGQPPLFSLHIQAGGRQHAPVDCARNRQGDPTLRIDEILPTQSEKVVFGNCHCVNSRRCLLAGGVAYRAATRQTQLSWIARDTCHDAPSTGRSGPHAWRSGNRVVSAR